jgi:sulfite oxidase
MIGTVAQEGSRELPASGVTDTFSAVDVDLIPLSLAIQHSEVAADRSRAAIDRSEAARRRSEAARQRARASRQSAQTALARATVIGSHDGEYERERTADQRDRLADKREATADERDRRADERDRIADTREAEADRRERRADERERLMDERERLVDQRDRLVAGRTTARDLQSRMISIRIAAAERAEKMAAEAEAYAAYLEKNTVAEDADKRLLLAQRERDIAAVERRNALRLREAGTGPLQLEGLPRLAT